MAIPEPSETTRNPESGAVAAELPPATPEPAPEPYTPEQASEWNRYYDRYVAGGVLLLAFLVSSHKITSVSSSIWPMLKAGELIARNGSPLTTDPFSFTEAGKRWVNIPWTYEVASHYLYTWGRTLFTADQALGAQIGAGALVAINALARLLTVWFCLRLRRPGPGLWWFALVAAVAFGCVYAPRGTQFEWSVGGIGRQANVGPETWGVLLLAVMVYLADRAYNFGKARLLYALPPIFLLWANLDESFVFGLLVLAAVTFGAILDRRPGRSKGLSPVAKGAPIVGEPSPVLSLVVLAASAAICLLNPSTYHAYSLALAPYLEIPKVVFGSATILPKPEPEHLAYFGRASFDFLANRTTSGGPLTPQLRVGFYLAIVLLGLSTFVLNRGRFNLARLLTFLVAAVLWGGLSRLSAEFAVVFVYAVGLNGQEWYQGRYGLAGRVGNGWTAWSVGGRAVTILAFFLVMAVTLTGYGYSVGRSTFGYGMEPSDFDFEAADHLKTLKLSGQVMNLSDGIGDAIIWRGYPQRKTFIDRRRGVFGRDIRQDITEFRKAFAPDKSGSAIVDDPQKWGPILDAYNVSAVIYSPEDSPLVFLGMRNSKNWIPIRDDGRTVLFGRADAKTPEADLATFKASRLDAADIVYRRKQLLPFPDRSPSAMTFIDKIIRNRSLSRPQPHVDAADRWLATGAISGANGLPDAAHCLMAIREARIALSLNPDDTYAYRMLDRAYQLLATSETAAMDGKLTTNPRDYLNFRARQRITALNYAIQTTPPPTNDDEKKALAQTHYDLALVHRATGDLDLERDNLAASRNLAGSDVFPSTELQRLDALEDAIQRFKDDLQRFATETAADGIQRATRALNAGFPGLALKEFEEALSQGVSLERILAILVDLYCRTGQPEKANELISGRTVNDQALFTGTGTPAYRIGMVNFLLGFYDNAVSLWRDYAISTVRATEANEGLSLARVLLSGQALEATSATLGLTGTPAASGGSGEPGLIDTEANWTVELGFCLLEAGDPKEAGKQFASALRLNPKIAIRPLLEDYLKKLDVPIPPADGTPPEGTKAGAEGEPKPTPATGEPAAEAAPAGKEEGKPDTPK